MASRNYNSLTPKESCSYYPIYAATLSKKLLFRAKVELNETDENTRCGLRIMKEKIKAENLYLEKDDVLIKFLRVKKYNFKTSFDSYKQYLRAVKMCLKQLKIPNFETFQYAARMNIGSVFPYRDADDRAILLYRLGAYHKVGLKSEDGLCMLLGLALCLTRDPATQIGGVTLLVDAKEMRLSDIPAVFSYARWVIPMLKGFPGRLRRVDIVNQSAIFGKLIGLISPFLPLKIRDRLMVHGCNYESLLQHYSPSIIPVEYGGSLGSLNNDHLMDRMETCYDYFQNDIMKNCGSELQNI